MHGIQNTSGSTEFESISNVSVTVPQTSHAVSVNSYFSVYFIKVTETFIL